MTTDNPHYIDGKPCLLDKIVYHSLRHKLMLILKYILKLTQNALFLNGLPSLIGTEYNFHCRHFTGIIVGVDAAKRCVMMLISL